MLTYTREKKGGKNRSQVKEQSLRMLQQGTETAEKSSESQSRFGDAAKISITRQDKGNLGLCPHGASVPQ